MNVIWNKRIEMNELWMPDCFGLFVGQGEQVTFFFKVRRNLLAVSEKEGKPRLLHSFYGDKKYLLPCKWALTETADASFVLFSEDRGFDLKSQKVSHDIPEELRMEYCRWQCRPEKNHVDAPQKLGEFTILHKGNWGYLCMRENTQLWEFTGRAYLYTDMMRWKNRLFFGTGGQGGYFYVLDINNGSPLASIKTGGTQCIVHVDNLCYILKNEKTAQLLCIDLEDGRTVSQCDLPGIATLESRLTKIDNCIHSITFHVSRSKLKGFTWSCVKI